MTIVSLFLIQLNWWVLKCCKPLTYFVISSNINMKRGVTPKSIQRSKNKKPGALISRLFTVM